MIFNSFNFIIFFTIVILVLSIVKLCTNNVSIRNTTLLLFSYYFYGSFNATFLIILLYVTLVNYIGGYLINATHKIKLKRIYVTVTTILSLLPLIFFKYILFISSTFSTLLSIELNTEFIEGLLLPIGISFFTFQALSYIFDLVRGKVEYCGSIINFSLFVSFFPTILSGPIEKAKELLPQIKEFNFPSSRDILQGVIIFIWGLFKKIVIADRLADYVDLTYLLKNSVGGSSLLLAACFFSIQIYADFSGYSDMALGIAKALGFNITKNFKQPYFSKTIKEFWRKWHIALTSWFTEYVYFSLGGNRVSSKWRWAINISLVFILSGIWHGAAWSFVIWGSLHAIYYLIEHFLGFQNPSYKWNKIKDVIGTLMVFVSVTFAWIFFRLTNISEALFVVGKIFSDPFSNLYLGLSSFSFLCTILMLLILIIYEILIRNNVISYDVVQFKSKLNLNLLSILPLIFIIALFSKSADSFVYFKF